MEIDEEMFVYPEEVRMVCEAFEIDSLAAIAEGSLLITARPSYSKKIVSRLNAAGIEASIVGKVLNDQKTRIIKRRDGAEALLEIPKQDPFWPIFFESVEPDAS